MSYRAKNNSFGQLASGLSAGATSMTLQAGQGDRFPVIANPDYTFVTLEDAAGNREIVKVTARNAASDVMTIVRAQEGSVARGWSAGDVVELRMTASLVETAMAHPAQTTGAHAASTISVTPTGNLASTNVQAALAELENEKADDFDVLEINRGGSGADTRHGALEAFGIEASEATILTLVNATTDIGASAANNILLTTGATSITGFAAAAAGVWRKVRMATGGVTLVHSTTFVLPGASDIVTAANDCFEAFYTGAAWIVRNYQKANGAPIKGDFVSKSGDTMTGSLTISNTAPYLSLIDTSSGNAMSLLFNDDIIGFFKEGIGWKMYVTSGGNIWTSAFGFISDYFAAAVHTHDFSASFVGKGMAPLAVGMIAYCTNETGGNISAGNTVSGAAISIGGATVNSGTWKNIGPATVNQGASGMFQRTL